MIKSIKNYIGKPEWQIIDAMKLIDNNSVGLLYICDNNGHLNGCITDGDIRRWIIKTGGINGTVNEAMNHSPRFLYEKEKSLAITKMENEQIYSIPILNNKDVLIDVIFHEEALKSRVSKGSSGLSGYPVIIMAGGKGTRLYPYTKILPKPLIPIGDIPILERIFMRFYQYGARSFFLTVNYRKEMIKSYFSETGTPYEIKYVEEDTPLGTAGSIRLIEEEFDRPVIITNCDILIEADYELIMDYHKNSGNTMTIVSSLKNMSIPYGVLHSKEHGIVTSMEEKPEISYFINTGMYVVEPRCLNLIPKGKIFHMTDLAESLLEKGECVGMFPISENSFLDMGQFAEMKRMEDVIEGRV